MDARRRLGWFDVARASSWLFHQPEINSSLSTLNPQKVPQTLNPESYAFLPDTARRPPEVLPGRAHGLSEARLEVG